jgi:hypothetical protein
MERSEVLEAMGELKLFGMRGAYDEIVATAVKRQHEPQRVIGDLLVAEINESEGPARHRSEGGPERRARSSTR